MNAPYVADQIQTDQINLGAEVIRRAAAVQYTDGDTGDDGADGLTWGTAKKTLEASWDELPLEGWSNHYVKGFGANKLEPSRTYWPRAGLRGHVRLHGCDPWTVVETGTITAYSLMTGRQGWDEYTIAWDGGYVADDLIDSTLWIEYEDDTATTFLRKIMTYNAGTGKYEVPSQWGFPTITGPVSVRLVRPTTQIHPSAFMRTGALEAAWVGSFAMQGVDFKPNGSNGCWGIGASACYIDATTHARAFLLNTDGVLGHNLTSIGVATGFELLYFDTASLVGTPLEGKCSPYFLPGAHLEMNGSGYSPITGGPRGNRVAWSTYKGGNFETWNGVLAIPYNFRGIGPAAGLNVYSESYLGAAYFLVDGDVVVDRGYFTFDDNQVGSLEVIDGQARSNGGTKRTLTFSKAAAEDKVALKVHPRGSLNFGRYGGGFDLATPGTPLPAVELEGDVADVDIDLDNADRGDGPMVLVKRAARVQLDECKGDNTNAGGSGDCVGLKIEDPSFVEIDVSECTATGADGDVKVGSLAAQVYPGAGTLVNDPTQQSNLKTT